MELLTQLLQALWAQDFETLANPSMIGMLYFVLFVILFLENGLLPAAFLPGDSLLVLVGVLIAKGAMGYPQTILLLTVAASLGCDAPMILACFVAVSGIFVTNVYPTSAFAISCDDTGSFMGKWSGTYVINHPFFLPGCLGLVAAIPFGFLMAGLVF